MRSAAWAPRWPWDWRPWSRGLIDGTSLVTALPHFDGIDLDQPDQFVVGGHDVRRTSYRQAVRELQQRSNIFEPSLADACMEDLDAWARTSGPAPSSTPATPSRAWPTCPRSRA